MAIVDRHGPYEPHLVPATLDARFFADLPTRLIGDRYDSDRLDDTLTLEGRALLRVAPPLYDIDRTRRILAAR